MKTKLSPNFEFKVVFMRITGDMMRNFGYIQGCLLAGHRFKSKQVWIIYTGQA